MDLRILFASLVVVSLVAGCINEPAPAPEEPVEDTQFSYEDDRIKIRGINKTAERWTPTLEEPPEWTLGQWWKVKVYEEFTGSTAEAYVVVAGQEDDFWLVGMPTHDFSNDLMVLHIPGFGQVQKADLSFEAHDVWFQPLKFPITEDEEWTTGFESEGNEECSVTEVDGLTARVECFGTHHIVIDYDAQLRNIRKMTLSNYGGYEVIDSGLAFHEEVAIEPVVTVPHMSDLIFFHGRVGGVVQVSPDGGPVMGLGVNPVPTDTVTIDSTYDRVSFSIILGDLIGAQNVAGPLPNTYYETTATAPDGTTYSTSLMATDAAPIKIVSFKHDAPGGDWEIQHLALGPGGAFLEGIGYHVYDVELPSGRLLPSIGEHQHGEGEGH